MSYPNVDRCCQLHEVIEVHYFVDVWEAQLYVADGHRMVVAATGSSVASAMDHMNRKLHGVSLDMVRNMPAIRGMIAYRAIRSME
jgi:hypothetical protein